MRILVTGSDGLLGEALQKVTAGLADEYIFTGYDDFDITDNEAVDMMIKVNSFDVVVNCAAVTDSEKAERYPKVAFDVNVKGVENLAVAIAREGGVLIQPGCNVFYLSEKSVISLTKRLMNDAVAQSGCDAVIINPILKSSQYWMTEIDRVALLIVDIITEIKHSRPHGVEIIEFKNQG